MAGIKSIPNQNAVQKTLDAVLIAGGTSATFNESIEALFPDVSATNPGVFVVDRVDSNGTKTPLKREYCTFTGVSGAVVSGVTKNADGSGSDQEHAVGAIVEFVPDVLWAQSVRDTFEEEHNADGTHNKTGADADLVSGTAGTDGNLAQWNADGDLVDGPDVLDEDDMASDSNTAVPTQQSTKAYVDAKNKYPTGFLVNGALVVSVASNNLTVAIKGINGQDPSATNVVSCRIGDTIRSITSALSVTRNAGTNWFNAGSSELATKEVDYFVYLGYNATDGIVIGFARIPHGYEYDSFSTTSTAESYCAISTITNAAAGDDYELVGRFAATLSAGAGYTWTVPTFTNKNLIQMPVYESRWLDWVPTQTSVGGAYTNAPTINGAKYKIMRNKMELVLVFAYNATSGGTGASKATMPFTEAERYQSLSGINATSGVSCPVQANAGILYIHKYDGTTPIVNNNTVGISGIIKI